MLLLPCAQICPAAWHGSKARPSATRSLAALSSDAGPSCCLKPRLDADFSCCLHPWLCAARGHQGCGPAAAAAPRGGGRLARVPAAVHAAARLRRAHHHVPRGAGGAQEQDRGDSVGALCWPPAPPLSLLSLASRARARDGRAQALLCCGPCCCSLIPHRARNSCAKLFQTSTRPGVPPLWCLQAWELACQDIADVGCPATPAGPGTSVPIHCH